MSTNHRPTFDATTALAGLYLWLIFGFFTSLLGCDLQRLIGKNIFVKHFMALVAFFFLFSVIDQSNKSDVGTTWLKTILVYVLFMLSIKTKNASSIAFVAILIVDQTIKLHMDYKTQRHDATHMDALRKVRIGLFVLLVTVAVVGFLHYFVRQYTDHYDDFSYLTFLFGSNQCNDL
jgi:hypothetical protein